MMETQDFIKASKVFKAVFEHTFDAVLLTDLHGRYVQSNKAALSLLGYCHKELMGLHAKDLLVMRGSETFQHYWDELREKGQLKGVISMLRKSGKTKVVKFKALADYFPGHHLFILSDITTEERQKRALREIAKVQSHEVRAPLCRLMGLVQLISGHDLPREEQASCLDHLDRTAKELDEVIRNIIHKSNLEGAQEI
jgi:PAS domain S-box-containing protein